MGWISGFFSWVGSLFGVRTTNTEAVTKIQAAAVKACGFLPTVDTVLALMSANPAIAAASVFANKICGAVNRANSVNSLVGDTPMKPMVDGVVIEGEFVGK